MAYTPTVYTDDASSPDLDATNLNKSENGIKDAHLIAVPVDCSSRVAEYTGDGIPQMPDNSAGVTQLVTSFSAVPSGWIINVPTPISTFTGNIWKIECDEMGEGYVRTGTSGVVVIRFRVLSGSLSIGFSSNRKKYTSADSTIQTVPFYSATSEGFVAVAITSTAVFEIHTIYIGTGAYTSLVSDRAGNGNSRTNTACIPVNNKFGKGLLFNKATSQLVGLSPEFGTIGTHVFHWKRSATGAERIAGNSSANTDGFWYEVDASNNLVVKFGQAGGTPISVTIKTGFTDTSSFHEIGFKSSGTVVTPIYDGIEGTPVTVTPVLGLANFVFGRSPQSSASWAGGILAIERGDSRIWSADEARAWYLNPISIDSRV